MISPLSFMKVKSIFITHFHGDHFLGLPGLIQSMNFSGREEDLFIFGPAGMVDITATIATLGEFQPSFNICARDIEAGERVDLGRCTVTAIHSDHTVPALSYVLEEPPRRGRFRVDRARELGVPRGPLFSQLQAGKSVTVRGREISTAGHVFPRMCCRVRQSQPVANALSKGGMPISRYVIYSELSGGLGLEVGMPFNRRYADRAGQARALVPG